MAITTNKRPRATIVSQDAVHQASTVLQELPEKLKESLSLRAAIEQMRSQIQAAFAKGYSHEEVSQLLNEQGIQISASTLKNYVSSGRRQATAEPTPATKARKQRTSSESTEEPIPGSVAASVMAAEPVSVEEQESNFESEPSDLVPAQSRGRRGKTRSKATTSPTVPSSGETATKRSGGNRSSSTSATTRSSTRGGRKQRTA